MDRTGCDGGGTRKQMVHCSRAEAAAKAKKNVRGGKVRGVG